MFRSFLIAVGGAGCLSVIAILLIANVDRPNIAAVHAIDSATSSVAAVKMAAPTVSQSTSTSATSTISAKVVASIAKIIKKATPKKTVAATPQSAGSGTDAVQIKRIPNPYSTPPLSFTTVNASARAALVNILCRSASGSLRPISGSGVVIDPRGVILTNAHVAQYVLLSESSNVSLSCVVRTGSPAEAHWSVRVLYLPPVWVSQHVADIRNSHPLGTGEHDYALLHITGSLDGSQIPASGFPYLPIDTRESIAFLGDQVLGASYPAEFLGGVTAQNGLYPVSSVSNIQQLLTFDTTTVDAISLGGVVEAQSGSSGGAAVNGWGLLVGIITTTSDGQTTSQRDLRATTLSYINRDIAAQSGFDLAMFLAGDPALEEADFTRNTAPNLIEKYIDVLSK
jgi:hypothetical protein